MYAKRCRQSALKHINFSFNQDRVAQTHAANCMRALSVREMGPRCTAWISTSGENNHTSIGLNLAQTEREIKIK